MESVGRPGDTKLVVAVNDVMAIGAMTAFRDAGLVPGRTSPSPASVTSAQSWTSSGAAPVSRPVSRQIGELETVA